MFKFVFLSVMLFGNLWVSSNLCGQTIDKDLQAIRQVMDAQQAAWSKGDIQGFMEGYWNSPDLMFVGKSGVNYGWEQTLKNYQKGYPNIEAMGQLTFTVLKLEKMSKGSAFMIGKWHLKRNRDELSGHFTLLWKKIKGKWLIVADHSS
jgi:ketosteroid isomerase-like protein